MSNPVGSAVSASSTSISWPRNGSLRPCERAEAKNRTTSQEVAFLQQLAHHLADLPGRADHTNADHLPSRSRVHDSFLIATQPERLVQRTTALSSSVSLISTEIRISEVEIRSMFTRHRPTPRRRSR